MKQVVVVIVAEGQAGDELVALYKRILVREGAVVRVVRTSEEAIKTEPDVLVFVSGGAKVGVEAERIAAEKKEIRVIVLTDSIPPGKVVLVKRGWVITDGATLLNAVFD